MRRELSLSARLLYGGNTESRQILTYDEIPKPLIANFDRGRRSGFYHQLGEFPVEGIARAVVVNFTHGSRRQGGSTLTQHSLKIMYFEFRATLQLESLTEVVMSLFTWLSLIRKEAIITALYANEVYWLN